MKIVIADDDPAARSMLTETVQELGYDPVPVTGGEEVLEKVRLYDCSVLLLDWTMTGMDGLEVCREIRRHDTEDENVCYIIMSSSRESTEDVSRALRAGADDYVSKNTHPAEFRARIAVGVRTALLEKKLIDLNNRLKFLVRTDSLTGLLNHSAILKELSMELDRASRDVSSTSILMADLDRFKIVNDTHGHQIGDRVLMAFANLLCRSCRSFDRIGRYGGEEFLVILPRTTSEEATVIGERIRSATENMELEGELSNLHITCSVGCYTAERSDRHPSSMVASADSALFRAKEAGRNRVVSSASDS
jgi:two-component system, cell cycle response regulator